MNDDKNNKNNNVVVKTVSRLVIPFIQLFGLYVIVHGALGPGGGFQGGMILGSSFILYAIVFGLSNEEKDKIDKKNTYLSSTGLYIYAIIGLSCILFSLGAAEFLNYGFIPLPVDIEIRRALLIDIVEIGIGLTVMATIVSIFINLAFKN